VLNAPQQATGGFIFVDALSAVTLAAATVLQISMRQGTQPPLDTQSFPVSNPANAGFMTTVLPNPSTAQNSPLHIRIHWTSQRQGLLDGFRMIGKHGSAIKMPIPFKFTRKRQFSWRRNKPWRRRFMSQISPRVAAMYSDN
jgi:hypothetical protein